MTIVILRVFMLDLLWVLLISGLNPLAGQRTIAPQEL
jgi:hypothetical protein